MHSCILSKTVLSRTDAVKMGWTIFSIVCAQIRSDLTKNRYKIDKLSTLKQFVIHNVGLLSLLNFLCHLQIYKKNTNVPVTDAAYSTRDTVIVDN